MKRALKILIPLCIVVALICGAAWYFLSYRTDLACDFYVSRAEAAAAQGRYDRAVRLYSRAWDLNAEDPSLAIDLANAYKQAGNYTKAEYTLVSAITLLPDCLDLYLELSRIYVEQNKLLDADQMLSRTANEAIQEQLSALRPDPPEIQPESGSYTEYIDVSLSYADGDAYLAVDGDYPSLETDLYTGPVTLDQGETTVVAMVVADGLVSEAVTAGYTIGGIVEEVTFADAGVENAVRTVLGKADGEPVMTNEMWSLTTLELSSDIQELSDLAICYGLTSLTVHDAYGIDFSVLSSLTSLEKLDLSNCTVSSGSLAAIASLPNLTSLRMSGCALTDISALSSLTTLTTLDLSGNVLTDISALSSLTALTEVNLSDNTIVSISSLAAAAELAVLDISDNAVTSLTPLSNKTTLRQLDAAQNQIADLTPLATCTALEELDISNNQVADLTPVASLTALSVLSADYNALTTLPDFSAAQSLTRISVSNNTIPDVSGLTGLPILNYVNIDYNQVSDLTPLQSCPNIVQIDAFSNPLTDVSALRDAGIIVNYDPTYTG